MLGRFTAQLGDEPLHGPHPGFPGIGGDEHLQRPVVQAEVLGLESVFFQLLGDDVPAGDLDLFQIGIAGEINDLHPVQKRSGNGVFVIGCGNKQNIAQVKGQLNKMIPEGCILLGVKYLQQSRIRVTLIITAKLVDFIDQNQAIAAPRLAQSCDDPPGHGADIRLSMTANLRFVPDAAET